MDRNTTIALILIGLIFIVWMYLTSPRPDTRTPVSEAQPADTVRLAEDSVQAIAEQRDASIAADTISVSADSLYARFDSLPASIITVETDRYIAQFSTRGGKLQSYKFKNFFYNNGDTSNVEMVPPWAEGTLGLYFPDAGGRGFDFNKIVFRANKSELKLSGSSSDKLILSAGLGQADQIELTYSFFGDRYDFDLRLKFAGASHYDLGEYYLFGWESGLESTEKNRQDDFGSFKALVRWASQLETFQKFDQGILKKNIEGKAKWIATRSKYFVVGIDPERESQGIQIEGSQTKVNQAAGQPGQTKISAQLAMPIHQRKTDMFDRFSIYIGPIDYEILKSYKNGYQEMVDLAGIFKPISLFIIWLMKNIYKVFPNYGIVIIIFTLLMKVAMYPLTSRSLKSMNKMKELHPKVKAIQEKYKNDPQQMNALVMKLYRDEKISLMGMGGCLLLVPQIPIFWALFSVFRNTILLRGAPFVGWIKDLSQPDATMILPLIMGLSMFVQQKMTMQDPKLKMFTYILPILFFFMFKGFSSGLVLYWAMYNILSLLETWLIRRPQQQSQTALSVS